MRRAGAMFGSAALLGALVLGACGGSPAASDQAPAGRASAAGPQDAAPAAASTGGFDGQRAFQHVADLVAIGPHSAGTDGGRRAQQYIISQLQGFGCVVDQQDFHASTPVGDVAMKNIIAKIPGASPDILLFTTHFDSKRVPNFVGADDGGSSTGVMLELARLVCQRKNALTVWIAFFDGEEAFNFDWSELNNDNTYGSRELAARMALAGELPHVRAFVLADMVGNHKLRIKRESQSTPWLTDLIWNTASRLGYKQVFVSESSEIEDDHLPFLHRGVAAADVIDFQDAVDDNYWHKTTDTLDKVSPRSLAIVGHVLIETLPQLENRFSVAANH